MHISEQALRVAVLLSAVATATGCDSAPLSSPPPDSSSGGSTQGELTTGTTGGTPDPTTSTEPAGSSSGGAESSTGGAEPSSGGAEPSCGDGVVDSEEACDDAGESQSCNADCTLSACGDGILNTAAGEACDDAGQSSSCELDCTVPACGDGVLNVEAGEECDDGGRSGQCTDSCTNSSCGDGIINTAAGEACDDAAESATCNIDCSAASCGDGILNTAAGEACDDAAESATCNIDCSAASCGDGIINAAAGEECDDETPGCIDCQLLDPQCALPYNEFTNADRNVTNNVPIDDVAAPAESDRASGSSDASDWVGAGWYRFTGDAGTQMSEVVTAPFRAATRGTGYLTEPHPVDEDGIVERTACFSWANSACSVQHDLNVVSCGDFYLYELEAVSEGYTGRYVGIDPEPEPQVCLENEEDCLPRTCRDVLQADPEAETGIYTLAGEGDILDFDVYCDMDTDGGGWTVVWSTSGDDNDPPMTSDTPAFGDPFVDATTSESYNLTQAQKVLLHSRSLEGLVARSSAGTWLKFDAPPFGPGLSTPSQHEHTSVRLTASDGTETNAWIGYSNYRITGGGDFNITGTTTNATWRGVTHHNNNYFHLNGYCNAHYLYSYSNSTADGDGKYNTRLALGDWDSTNPGSNCINGEGGGLALRLNMR